MQLFEIALLLLILCLPFGMYWQNQIPFKQIGLGLLATTLLLHLILEGLRWQMTPIYLASIVVGLCLVKNYAFFKGAWYRKLLSGLFLSICIGLGFFLSTTLPVFDFPTPTGAYTVGSQWIQLDTDRAESITEAPTDTRILMVKAWYPSIEKGTPEPYLDQAERIGFATKYGLPKNTFNYLDKVETNTSPGATVADGIFPILLFSHGYYSNATGYQVLIEEVVSQGFIVLNLNHTFESVGAQFNTGEMHLYDVAFDRKNNNEEMAKMTWESTEAFHKAEGLTAKIEAIKPSLKNYVAADITERWAADIGSVLAELPNWATSSFLAGHLDTSKIGVFGHSQGGAATGQALLDYPSL